MATHLTNMCEIGGSIALTLIFSGRKEPLKSWLDIKLHPQTNKTKQNSGQSPNVDVCEIWGNLALTLIFIGHSPNQYVSESCSYKDIYISLPAGTKKPFDIVQLHYFASYSKRKS